jgi:hypothetical protein
MKRTFKRIVAGYKSLSGIVVRGDRRDAARHGRPGLRLVHHRQSVLPEPPRPGVRDGRDDLREHGRAGRATCARHPGMCRYAWSAAPVALFVAPQAILAVHMTKHRGKLAVLKEIFLVLTCLKPAVEIWRLAHGAEHDPGAPMEPKVAMFMGKVTERVLESIPAAILQSVTLLDHADARSAWAVASIVIACVATAFVATTIAFNKDTDPEGRHHYPQFHGCGPPSPAAPGRARRTHLCLLGSHGSKLHSRAAGTWATRPRRRRAASACSSSCTSFRSCCGPPPSRCSQRRGAGWPRCTSSATFWCWSGTGPFGGTSCTGRRPSACRSRC